MTETIKHTIGVNELRKMIRAELIREMQEPVDLALVGDIDDLPPDMVTELPQAPNAKTRHISVGAGE